MPGSMSKGKDVNVDVRRSFRKKWAQ